MHTLPKTTFGSSTFFVLHAFFYSSRAFGGWLKGRHGGGGGFGAVLLSAFEMDDGGT